jgi:predicted esterase
VSRYDDLDLLIPYFAVRSHHASGSTFAAHAQSDRFVPHGESVKLVDALKANKVDHEWWSVPGDHDFDAWDMQAGEEGEFDQEFASRLWSWLDSRVR